MSVISHFKFIISDCLISLLYNSLFLITLDLDNNMNLAPPLEIIHSTNFKEKSELPPVIK